MLIITAVIVGEQSEQTIVGVWEGTNLGAHGLSTPYYFTK